MRESALAGRRRALVEKLIQAVIDEDWMPLSPSGSAPMDTAVDAIRARFTAILASRWQT